VKGKMRMLAKMEPVRRKKKQHIIITICIHSNEIHVFLYNNITRSSYKEGGYDHINWFNHATFWCLYHARSWIFNVIWLCHLFVCSV